MDSQQQMQLLECLLPARLLIESVQTLRQSSASGDKASTKEMRDCGFTATGVEIREMLVKANDLYVENFERLSEIDKSAVSYWLSKFGVDDVVGEEQE